MKKFFPLILLVPLCVLFTSCSDESDFFSKTRPKPNQDIDYVVEPERADLIKSNLSPSGLSDSNLSLSQKIFPQTDEFQQLENNKREIDILWVIDNSRSMSDEQSSLASNFNAFISKFDTEDVDFKMAITTTDSRELYRGQVVKGSIESLNSAKSAESNLTFINNFKKMVKVGIEGSGIEAGLSSIINFVDVHGSNFIRDEALLVTIIVTDEDDQSPLKVADYSELFKKVKKDPNQIMVFSIVDIISPSVTQETLVKGSAKYRQFSSEMGGHVLDIKEDFHKSLNFIGQSVKEVLSSFTLTHDPIEGSVMVYVNDQLIDQSVYQLMGRQIKFLSESIPASNASIRVEFSYNG